MTYLKIQNITHITDPKDVNKKADYYIINRKEYSDINKLLEFLKILNIETSPIDVYIPIFWIEEFINYLNNNPYIKRKIDPVDLVEVYLQC